MKKQNHKDRAHALLSPSASQRWLNCPGSVALSKDMPESDSDASIEGTRQHEFLEMALRSMRATKTNTLVKKFTTEFQPNDAVKQTMDYVTSQWGDADEVLIEEKVDNSFIDKECDGSADVSIVKLYDTLEVIDYKNGSYPVSPEKNTQMILYGLGIAHKYNNEFINVKLTIAQPNAGREDGNDFPSWEIPMEELLDYIPLMKKGVERTRQPNARLFAGEHCKFCPAKIKCPQIQKQGLEGMGLVKFESVSQIKPKVLPMPKDMNVDQIAKVLDSAYLVETWINDVRTYAQDLLEQNGNIPGYELVPKRATRYWKSPEATHKKFAKLKVECYKDPELLSPSEMEKKTKKGIDMKDVVASLVVSKSNGMKIAKSKPQFESIKTKKGEGNEKRLKTGSKAKRKV